MTEPNELAPDHKPRKRNSKVAEGHASPVSSGLRPLTASRSSPVWSVQDPQVPSVAAADWRDSSGYVPPTELMRTAELEDPAYLAERERLHRAVGGEGREWFPVALLAGVFDRLPARALGVLCVLVGTIVLAVWAWCLGSGSGLLAPPWS
jgi:hypothetical protein